jgi:hypothetical protein
MKYRKNFLKYAEVDIEELCFGLGTGPAALDADLDRQIRICNTVCKTYRYLSGPHFITANSFANNDARLS